MNALPMARGKSDFAGLLEIPGRITPSDVLYFRREVFRDGVVSRSEADAIFAMNDSITDKCSDWNEFFLEALTDYVVNQAEPRGYVTTGLAEWLIERVSHDGHIEAANELELLVKVLDRSRQSPEILVGFVLGEIARVVIDGTGPLANGRQLAAGSIGEGEVELIRRVLYAFGGEASISISKTEAEILFELNERTADGDNHPAWRELFVKAIANYLLAAATDRAPSRAEAIVREAWLDDTRADIGSTLFGAVWGMGELLSRGFLDDMFDGAHEQIEKAWAERNARREEMESAAERVSDVEAEWLIDKLSRDHVIDENEKHLLDFIKRNAAHVDPSLHPVMEQAGIGAD